LTAQPRPLTDETDRKILQILQDNFPLVEQPYEHLAQQLNLNETQVIERLTRLSQQGITRKIGAVIDITKLGLNATTLIAAKVPPERIDVVADVINQYPQASHNYQRENEYSVWFTLKANNLAELNALLEEIVQKASLSREDLLNLPTKTCFKIDVRFDVT
jgi:DNA-binding Lrp family transcriptional regulator